MARKYCTFGHKIPHLIKNIAKLAKYVANMVKMFQIWPKILYIFGKNVVN